MSFIKKNNIVKTSMTLLMTSLTLLMILITIIYGINDKIAFGPFPLYTNTIKKSCQNSNREICEEVKKGRLILL